MTEVGGSLWLPRVMEMLVERGITRLLVEGGPATWAAFSRAALIDETVLFHARAKPTEPLGPIAAQKVLQTYVSTMGFTLYDQRRLGDDDMLAFRRPWRSAPRARTPAK
jgi:diaminohydroxyphosphoribosylaminopyrimidine deaminase/5-amino-6-(5-phosphoribosylamino)uracil reductase